MMSQDDLVAIIKEEEVDFGEGLLGDRPNTATSVATSAAFSDDDRMG
jgi:hypothetical protein